MAKHFRSATALICLGMVAAACGGSPATSSTGSEKSYTVRLSYTSPAPPFFLGQMVSNAADQVKSDTGGRVTFQIFPGGQLYNDNDAIQALQRGGGIEMAVTSSEAIESVAPTAKVFELPYLMPKDTPDAYNKLAGPQTPAGKAMQSEAAKKGIEIVGGWFVGGLPINSKVAINGLSDLKGLKVRMVGSGDIQNSVASKVGFTPVNVAQNDVGTGLRQGLVDGAFGTNQFFATFPDAAKYVVDLGGLFLSGQVVIANKAWWDKLSAGDQKALIGAFATQSAGEYDLSQKSAAPALDKLKSTGHVFITWNASTISDAEAQTQSIYTQYRSKLGGNVVDAVLAERKKLNG